MVLGAEFALGMNRVPFLVPHIPRGWLSGRSLFAGLLAMALMIAAELALATVVQELAPAEFIASGDKVSGSVYLVLLLVFAGRPRFRASAP